MRLLSIVEAATITGPVKPLLMFAALGQKGIEGHAPMTHTLLTTVRGRRNQQFDNELLRAARGANIDVDIVPERHLFDPGVVFYMARAIRARAPDIVETHDFKSHFLYWLLRRTGAIGTPHWLAFHHGYTKMSPRVLVYQQLDRVSLRHADQVVTLCQPFVEQLAMRGVQRSRITVISNAVEPKPRPSTEALARLRQSLGVGLADRLIVSVGRLSKEKGHADLIRAFRSLLQTRPYNDCKLVLVGEGGEHARLVADAADLGERVLFTGHQPDSWPYFCIADLFVLPSHTEGSPLALFEAMAAGVPILATTVGGIPEAVESGVSAILVPPADISGLTDALASLLNNSAAAAALGNAARNAARAFSPEAYATRLLRIYASVMGADEILRPVRR